MAGSSSGGSVTAGGQPAVGGGAAGMASGGVAGAAMAGAAGTATAGTAGAAQTGLGAFPSTRCSTRCLKAAVDAESDEIMKALDAIGWATTAIAPSWASTFRSTSTWPTPAWRGARSRRRPAFTHLTAIRHRFRCRPEARVKASTTTRAVAATTATCSCFQSSRLYELYQSNITGGRRPAAPSPPSAWSFGT